MLLSLDPRVILSRVVDELHDELNEKVVHDDSLKSSKNDEVQELVRKLNGLMLRVKSAGCKAFIIIDALNKVKESGQTMKVSYPFPSSIGLQGRSKGSGGWYLRAPS